MMRLLGLTACVLLAGCSSPGAAPSLERVEPPRVDAAEGTPVELRGAHLRPSVQVDFDRPSSSVVNATFTAWVERDGGPTDLVDVTWQTPELVTATVPGGLSVGVYDVHLVDPRGHEAMLAGAIEVVDCLVSACPLPDGGDPTEHFDAGWVACADFTFADLDVDGYGLPDSGAFLCGDFRAPVADDCNDQDGLTHPDAGEVCNRIDDDCDGVVDEEGCPDGGAAWTRVRSAGPDWETTWSWSKGALWIAGGSDVLVRRAGAFDSVSNACPGSLIASWAEPSGRAYLAGGNPALGRLVTHALTSNACSQARQVSDPMPGIVGFPRADGGVDVAGVLRNGRLIRGADALDGPEQPSNRSSSFRFDDLHGVAPQTLYAVGASSSEDSARMKVFRLGADGGWVDEHVERLDGLPRGMLRAVWVLDAERVVAVGDRGVVLERSRFGWRRLRGLDSDLHLTGVRAFDPGRVYVTDDQGAVRRWTGQRWERIYDGSGALRDITGTGEDDLWCVGSGGAVVHWPE